MLSTFKFTFVVVRVAASAAAVIALAASATGSTTDVSAAAMRRSTSSEGMQTVRQSKQIHASSAPVNGACGEDHRSHRSYIPLKLCQSGTPGDFLGEGPWQWRCAGEAGGKSQWCSATYDGK